MVQAIIFDMDGVIVDSMNIHYNIWKKTGEKFGFVFDKDLLDSVNGMDTLRIAHEVIEKFSLSVNADEIVKFKRELSENALKSSVKLFDDVFETINFLKETGKKIGLATSTPSNQMKLTLGQQINKLPFDTIITDDLVQNPKPAPDIFMKCAETLGVPYSDCAVIEDSLCGIHAAKTAGMIGIAITNTTVAEKFTEADYIISNLTELKEMIKKI